MANEKKAKKNAKKAAVQPVQLSEDEELFIVERVIGKRRLRGELQYHIKWEGFDSSENTWEPVGNLDCAELIEQFENVRKQGTGTSKTKQNNNKTKADDSDTDDEPAQKKRRSRSPVPEPENHEQLENHTESNSNNDESGIEVTSDPVDPLEDIDETEDTVEYADTDETEDTEDKEQPIPIAKNVGFEFGHEPSSILGASAKNGRLVFLVSWKDGKGRDMNKMTYLPAVVANEKIPQMVIKFYEARLSWAEVSAQN